MTDHSESPQADGRDRLISAAARRFVVALSRSHKDTTAPMSEDELALLRLQLDLNPGLEEDLRNLPPLTVLPR